MMKIAHRTAMGARFDRHPLAKELSQSLVLLALTGSSVGGLLGMVAIATRALGR